MASDRGLIPKVNWFDGMKVTESDLDSEQIYNQSVRTDLVTDFHGSGVVDNAPFQGRILLDTRTPGLYSPDEEVNPSKTIIEGGNYDGLAIQLDKQPSDNIRGNRLEIEVANAVIAGRVKTKVLILGKSFDGIDSGGHLVAEVLEFSENTTLLTQFFYVDIIGILLNNFAGGTGRTEILSSVDSQDLITDSGGWIQIREAKPLFVYPAVRSVYQAESPNIALRDFITSDVDNSITEEIENALGSDNDIGDLYLELESKEQLRFEKNGNITVAYGQKFLAKSNNIQRIDLLLSTEEDNTQTTGNEFDFSGEIVISIHELATETACPTDAVPDDLLGFDPELTPLMEISFGQEDLEAQGIVLGATPQIVGFNFAGTLIADPNIEPTIQKDKFYAFLVTRRGDNRTGTILLEQGYDTVTRKTDLNQPLTTLEQFGKRTTSFLEFDPNTKRYVDDEASSLWFVVYADAVEITDGTAYADDGVAVTVPKTEEFVGGTEISFFLNNLSLRDVGEGVANYVILSHIDKFTTPDVHPRTGTFVFTRILDSASAAIVSEEELSDIREDVEPLILARLRDRNVRDAQNLNGTIDKPGLISQDEVLVIDPSSTLLNANLINRIFIPDQDCQCNDRYRIIEVSCQGVKAGDLNGDNVLDSQDIIELLNVVGNTLNSDSTERKILGGDLDILDFVKSDLNQDLTVDGLDINLLEEAVDGYANFTVESSFRILRIKVENLLESNDYPLIFTDIASSGTASSGTNTVSFDTSNYKEALVLRSGDHLEIPTGEPDVGVYLIASKSIASNNTTVTVTITELDGSDVELIGSTGFNVTVTSGTRVNMLADNLNLVQVPFVSTSYSINFIESPFESRFLDACDLRRFVGTSFLEEQTANPCLCPETSCVEDDTCEPVIKNQVFIPNDLYIPNGEIFSEPGVPYHGDYEYSSINLPLPPGTIQDCQLDLYTTFVKVYQDCKTIAGYPAMKYSDGTFVGCEDSGTDTDIAKGKVKFSKAISSLHVDALVDGYAIDGYADAQSTNDNVESIEESFVDFTFTSFDTWTEDPGNDIFITTVSHPSGANQPAVFGLSTTSDSSAKFGRLNSPVSAQSFEDDFVIDFTAYRSVWPEASLLTGTVSSFTTLTISNLDGSTATIKFGWRQQGADGLKYFFSGVIENNISVIVSTFDFDTDALDEVGDTVLFRLRRIDDSVTAYFLIPSKLDLTNNLEGSYTRLGDALTMQPGSGPASMDYEIRQESSPTSGLSFFTNLTSVIILSEYTSNSTDLVMTLSRDTTTSEASRVTLTFPLDLTGRTNIVSASLKLTAAEGFTSSDTFNVIPLYSMNADNIGRFYNISTTQNTSTIASFIPGTVVADGEISIEVTGAISSLLAQIGHLSGYIKGFLIEPDITANSSFTISNQAELVVDYEDITTGVVFQVGIKLDTQTGIATFNTKNILYDATDESNRTVLNFGVYLKKSGFRNSDISLTISDLNRLGVGNCSDESAALTAEDECFFVVGQTGVGTFVEGPFSCNFVIE